MKTLTSLAEDISGRYNKMVPLLSAAERDTDMILDLTANSCDEMIHSLNLMEATIATSHSRMMASMVGLQTILVKRQSKFSVSDVATDLKQQRTPPSPVEKAPKKRTPRASTVVKQKPRSRATSATRSDAELMPPPSSIPGKTGISPNDLSLALTSISTELPEIRIPRCDRTAIQTRAEEEMPSTVMVTPKMENVYGNLDATRQMDVSLLVDVTKPPPGISTTIFEQGNMAMDLLRTPQAPVPLNIWECNFGTYANPLMLGQQPPVFDLRQKLDKKNTTVMRSVGRGRGKRQIAATVAVNQPIDPQHTDLLPLHFEGDKLQPYPDEYLASKGGTPPIYSPYLSRKETEWPLFLKARIPGEDWRGVYLDRHCSMSVIGEAALPDGVHIRQTPARLHVDVPWRGRGEPFYYFQIVTIPIAFDGGSIRLRQDFGVVRALQTSIILGHDFTVSNGVWSEYRGDGGVRVHIRDKIVEAQRAIKAYHRPDRVDRVAEEFGPY